MRWVRPLTVAGGVALAAAGIAVGFALTGNNTNRLHEAPLPPAASESSTPTPAVTVAPVVPTALSLPVGLPLWPYADGVGAAADTSPASWHQDPAQTALRFTTQQLRFTDDNLALSTQKSSDGQQAWVSIGYHTEGSRTATAAVVHVARWSVSGPWEVVGTRDTTLALTKPSYGATASSPLAVGGQIQGVDESIRVAVQQSSSSTPLGVACCTAAGTGPWSAKVSYTSTNASVLMVVASTGGHLIEHERWALTAVRNPNSSGPSSTAPATFVATASGRVGLYRTSDGSRIRWLTAAAATGSYANAQHVGSDVYFAHFGSKCGTQLLRVPDGGGAASMVYNSTTTYVDGFTVSRTGNLAISETRCSDSMQHFLAVNKATGQSHATPYIAQPPSIQGNPAWAPDGVHVLLSVRTGTSASVRLVPAFTVTSVLSGTNPCGGTPSGRPALVTYAGSSALVELETGSGLVVASCNNGATHNLFTIPEVNAESLDGDASGSVIAGTVGGDAIGPIYVWSGGHLRTLHTESAQCSSVSKTPYPCPQQAQW